MPLNVNQLVFIGNENNYYDSWHNEVNLSWFVYLFEAFSCTCLHPNLKAWRLARLKEVPSVLDEIPSPSNPLRTSPKGEKEFQKMSCWVCMWSSWRHSKEI